MSQILRTLSELLGLKRATLTTHDLDALEDDARGYLLEHGILAPSRPATHVTCDACYDDHIEEVVRIKDGRGVVSFRIACPDAGWVEVPEANLKQWVLDAPRIAGMLAKAIGLDSPDELIPEMVWRIGTAEIAGESFEIVFVRSGRTASEALFADLKRRILPAHTIVVGIDDIPDSVSGIAASVSLESAFAIINDEIVFQLNRIRSLISAETIIAGNVFQLRGDKWQLSFDGETKFLKNSAGLHYIACLLREPERIIPVPILHEMVTGVPAEMLNGTSEPYFTTETLQNYRNRLEQLREDRTKADKNEDSSWLARIDREVEQIEIELGYNLGLNESIRERSDYLKVKRKIAEYIRRGKTAVSKKHASLGLHLENSIKTRGGFRYEPERDIGWVT